MMKKGMVERTMEGFIRMLEKDGHSKYASELRAVVAMSRRRREAVSSLSAMTPSLLVHVIKLISMPRSINRNKWHREVKSYLSAFDIRNLSPKGMPWLSIEYIKADMEDVLSSPAFLSHLDSELEDFPAKDRKKALSLAGTKTLEGLNVDLSYGATNNLKISINGQICA